MREIITLQCGQAGNQLGWRYWSNIVAEHSAEQSLSDAASTFLRDASSSRTPDEGGYALNPCAPDFRVRARAVLVDTEEGVVNQVLRSPLGALFDGAQIVTDVSGAGNNWAHGFHVYGPQYGEAILDRARVQLEACDSPQSFFLFHSLGGGTGSGLGSYILEALSTEFPDLYRFSTAVCPSPDADDVVTSSYNYLLSLDKLSQFADCVFPVENSSLMSISEAIRKGTAAASASFGPGSFSVAAVRPPLVRYINSSLTKCMAPVPGITRSVAASAAAVESGHRGSTLPLTGSRSAAAAAAMRADAATREQHVVDGLLSSAETLLHESRSIRNSVGCSGAISAPLPLQSKDTRIPARGKAATAIKQAPAASSGAHARVVSPYLSVAARPLGRPRGPTSSSSSSRNGPSSLRPEWQSTVVASEFSEELVGDDDDDGNAATDCFTARTARSSTAWDDVNNIVAHLLTHVTASMRFEGQMNVDLNELATTLVPFPRLHFLQSSLSPLLVSGAELQLDRTRRLDKLAANALLKSSQLSRGDPKKSTHFACGFLWRGDASLSDATRCVGRAKADLPMVQWNVDGEHRVYICMCVLLRTAPWCSGM